MVKYGEIAVKTTKRCEWIDISGQVQSFVSQSDISTGICTVNSLHTTAAITLNENADPDVQTDFFRKLAQIAPIEPYFRHSEGNSDSHIKASLVGLSVQIPVNHGSLVLGTWQSVYFCEFDGPRNRRVSITLIGE
ncbi:MAG: YjbQ family protein [Fibrobacter sp.]|nr:YjbQ family protein [Fibrobacter sp.]